VSGEAGRLLTAKELAARWQVREQHVYALARDGGVPHVRIGRYVRFRLAAIEAWEAQQEGMTYA
jgi:excisionase family DNA binding protein